MKKRLTSNTGSGLYSANYWRAKFALFTDQCISRVGSLEILIKQLAFQNWLHFLNILLPYIRCMPIPAILFHTIANIIFQWSTKVVRGGATKGTLVSWILATLVHNYLVLGYKNENNSGYAWKLPGVNNHRCYYEVVEVHFEAIGTDSIVCVTQILNRTPEVQTPLFTPTLNWSYIFGARITLILIFARKNTIGRLDLPKMKRWRSWSWKIWLAQLQTLSKSFWSDG